ncbi:LptF/LptG family permease [Aestuariispira insulae]|nr:LptF/LptG family permease [Aestuariispira insulae]
MVTRYISRQITVVTIVATLSMCMLITLVQSVRFIELIVNNGLPLSEFLRINILAAPRYLVYLLPIVLFGATLFTYNRMINDSELIVLRAAGFSRGRLSRPGLLLGVIITAILYSQTLYFLPASQSELRTILLQARSEWGAAFLREGRFTSIGDNVTIFIRERTASGELVDLLYHNQKDQLTIIAERGAIIDRPDGPRIIVKNGSKQFFKDGRLHLLSFEQSSLDVGLSKKSKELRWIEPQERFLPDLLNPDLSDPSVQQFILKIKAEAHNRILSPVIALTLASVAIAIILGGGFSRRGQTKTILSAIGVMLTIYIGNISLVNAAGGNAAFVPAIYANALLPLAASLIFILMPKQYRKRPAEARPQS